MITTCCVWRGDLNGCTACADDTPTHHANEDNHDNDENCELSSNVALENSRRNLEYLHVSPTVELSSSEKFKTRIKYGLNYTKMISYNVCASASIVITCLYFSFLYPYIKQFNSAYIPTAIDINMHAICTILLILEVPMLSFHIRIIHFIFPMLYSLVYVLFSLIYWLCDRTNNVLYPVILDWGQPAQCVFTSVLVVFVAIPLTHCVLVADSNIIIFLYHKIQNNY